MSFCCRGISTVLRARLFNQIEVVGEALRRRTRLLRRRIIGSYGIFPKAVFVMTGTNGTPGNNDNGHSVPQPRAEWIARRKAENTDGNFSQMRYARRGVITEEIEYVAPPEKLASESLRQDAALAGSHWNSANLRSDHAREARGRLERRRDARGY